MDDTSTTKNHQPRVLLIEDELALQKAISESLTQEGYLVDAATDAEAGKRLATEHTPDTILLDLILPGKSGFELLSELKSLPEFARIPVVILSNLGDEEDIRQGMQLGAVDYLVKADNDLNSIAAIVKKYAKK